MDGSQGLGAVEIGVDIGGTFTDVVCAAADGSLRLIKIPTTRGNQSAAVRQAMDHMVARWGVRPAEIGRFAHGTTAATNAVLERKGAVTGLLTTAGFRDVLEIGRQYRREMYDLDLKPGAPTFLIPGARRKGVRERIGSDGAVVVPLDEASVRQAVAELLDDGVETIAVAFLFSFIEPAHERRAREIIREMAPHLDVSLSSEVDPAFREYERTCVTAFDAYVKPVLRRYLEAMEADLAAAGVAAPLQVMQSRGGLSRAATACERPVRLFLSGPAAGVIGGQAVGRMAAIHDLITIDIGGTSSDIALITGGQPVVRNEGLIDGYAVRVPMVDVNAIGAGGGSIAWIDGAGGLRVGPQSAGSEPGPACYGRGGLQATVTDASIVLGYIDPAYFAGGTLALDPALARRAVEDTVARPLGLTLEQAATGIHRVINGQMAEGIRLVSIRRGIDPRGYTLVALGGGGGLHATALAEELGMKRVLVPLYPGVLSACGLLSAPTEHEVSTGFHRVLQATRVEDMQATFAELDERARGLMAREALAAPPEVGHFADLCYVGQSYYLEIPVGDLGPGTLERMYRDFLEAHDRIYGHASDSPVRIANLRTVHRSGAARDVLAAPYVPGPGPARKGTRRILVADVSEMLEASVWDRLALAPGTVVAGPAIVEQMDTTTLIGPGWTGEVAADGNLILTSR
ncbi:MAG: hydantoinase/oxoprolinase family protein [Alphaproteobacteria bacterium]|nr:hydantoinase/oxoprolinase family protein [Alphaproteobacteria bacterium]